MTPYSKLGQITLGSQLRLLSDMMTTDAAAIYEHFGSPLDPKWFPVLYVLATEEHSTVTSIAAAIGHSHVSVSKIASELKAAKLTLARRCPDDSRRTLISLSKTGKKLVPTLLLQCQQVDRALSQLTEETGINFWEALNVTMQSLKHTPLSERIKNLDKITDFNIVDFTPRYLEDFKQLNLEWITRYFELEEADRKVLEHPTQYIINRGGAILIALYEDKAVGSVALIPYKEKTLELAKMAVSPTMQGKGLGFALGQLALQRARRMGASRVYLETNSQLTAALALYRKLGFSDVVDSDDCSPYTRCNVRMQKSV